ncbi:Uncharacterised protein [Segatella copri]|nr:Uncharacterised protein [Segatella copri]
MKNILTFILIMNVRSKIFQSLIPIFQSFYGND